MKIKEVISVVQSLAPERYAASWDNSGVQVRGTRQEAQRVAVCLDPLPERLAEALDWGADLVVAHHPLFLKPTPPTTEGPYLAALRLLLPAGVWLYSAHTSLDSRPYGPACWLGDELGLEGRRALEPSRSFGALSVSFFLEEDLGEELADALAEVDGVFGIGQDATGEVRLLCHEAAWSPLREALDEVLAALGSGHTQYFLTQMRSPSEDVGFGEVGLLPGALDYDAFAARLGALLGAGFWTEVGPRPEQVRRVAYLPGSGASALEAALAAQADVFITGDVKYHQALDAAGAGLHVLDVGHFPLEEEMMRRFATELATALPGVELRFFPGRDPFAVRMNG
ncbi:MAG: Nif3-like dinuclear metal center hexameric protein [Desulfovibrio sp.]